MVTKKELHRLEEEWNNSREKVRIWKRREKKDRKKYENAKRL